VALLLAAAIAWELCARSGSVSPILFPSLARIGRELGLLLVQPRALAEAGASLYRALAGFGLAAEVGVALGIAMGRWPRVAGVLDPWLSATYPIPKIALFPVFIFLFGIGSLSKILLVFLECLYPIAINTYAGARAVDRVLVWSARNMGAGRGRILWRVVVPAAAPAVFTGFRVALPVAMIVVVITEMIGSADGLGYLVIYALASFRTDRMLAVVVVIAGLGLALDRLLVLARRRIVFWERFQAYFS
jgi:ABC-type nitrate/sulfonate/bicarbonate transport system permease component